MLGLRKRKGSQTLLWLTSLHSGKSLLPTPSQTSLPPHESQGRLTASQEFGKVTLPSFPFPPPQYTRRELFRNGGRDEGGKRRHPGETRNLVSCEIIAGPKPQLPPVSDQAFYSPPSTHLGLGFCSQTNPKISACKPFPSLG